MVNVWVNLTYTETRQNKVNVYFVKLKQRHSITEVKYWATNAHKSGEMQPQSHPKIPVLLKGE